MVSIMQEQVESIEKVEEKNENENLEKEVSKVALAATGTVGSQPSAASLYVGDLLPNIAEKELFEFFKPIGDVASVRVCRDSVTRRSLCYAYVNFASFEDGVRALDELNYTPIDGKPCRLMWSQRDPALRKSGTGNVFIKNLDPDINNKGLDEVFKVFGPILSCKVSLTEDGNSGYGFVHFATKESAEQAIAAFDGVYFNDRKVSVCLHEPRKNRENRIVSARMNFTNVYVKNLPEHVTEDELRNVFETYGKVLSVVVAKSPENLSRGFGFVNFEDHLAAEAAVESLNKSELLGSTIHVCRAQKKLEREESLRKDFENRRQEWIQKFQGSNLYVKNLDDDCDDAKLRAEFSPYGTITSCRVMMDEKNNSRGFGFVCFSCPEEAAKACSEVNGRIINKKPLYVGLAQTKDNRRAQLQASYLQMNAFPQFANVGGIIPPQIGQGSPSMYGGNAPMFYSAAGAQNARNSYYGPTQQQMAMRQRWAAPQQVLNGVAQGIPVNGVPSATSGSGAFYAMNSQQLQYPQNGVMNGPSNGNQQMNRVQRVNRGQPQSIQYVSQAGQQIPGMVQQGVNSVRTLPPHQQRMSHNGGINQKQAGFKYTAGARNMGAGVPISATSGGYSMEMNSNGAVGDHDINHIEQKMEKQLQLEHSNHQKQFLGMHEIINLSNNIEIDPSQLAKMSGEARKQHLGEALYGLIHPIEKEFAPKITGMLLDMGDSEVLELLQSPEKLHVKVREAVGLLRHVDVGQN